MFSELTLSPILKRVIAIFYFFFCARKSRSGGELSINNCIKEALGVMVLMKKEYSIQFMHLSKWLLLMTCVGINTWETDVQRSTVQLLPQMSIIVLILTAVKYIYITVNIKGHVHMCISIKWISNSQLVNLVTPVTHSQFLISQKLPKCKLKQSKQYASHVSHQRRHFRLEKLLKSKL